MAGVWSSSFHYSAAYLSVYGFTCWISLLNVLLRILRIFWQISKFCVPGPFSSTKGLGTRLGAQGRRTYATQHLWDIHNHIYSIDFSVVVVCWIPWTMKLAHGFLSTSECLQGITHCEEEYWQILVILNNLHVINTWSSVVLVWLHKSKLILGFN